MRISGWELGWLPRRFAQFLGWAVDCCPDLHKSWAEQPAGRKICTNLARRVGWQDCAILEPSRLLERISQSWSPACCQRGLHNFWRERWLPSECTIFKGKLLNLQLDQVRVSSLWREKIKLWSTGWLWARKTLKLEDLTKQGKLLWRLVGRLQNRLRQNFGGWL